MSLDHSSEAKITQLVLNELDTSVYELDKVSVFRSHGRTKVMVTMDKTEGGITMDECAEWNRKIGQLIEDADLIQDSYVIEVSSPGLDRPLKEKKHFEKVVGKNIRLQYRARDNKSQQGVFTLVSVNGDTLSLKPYGNDEEIKLTIQDVMSAKREISIR